MQLRSIPSIIIVVSFLLTSCATQTFLLTDNATLEEATSENTSHFFLHGVFQHKTVNAHKICYPRNVSHVETEVTFFDAFIVLLCRGIYSPRTMRVYCKGNDNQKMANIAGEKKVD